jgi:uncharacterized protein (DUF433 family)
MYFPETNYITMNPAVMGGKLCIRGMRVTVGTITGLVASGASFQEILDLYPYLEEEDIRAALAYASWRSEEYEIPLQTA